MLFPCNDTVACYFVSCIYLVNYVLVQNVSITVKRFAFVLVTLLLTGFPCFAQWVGYYVFTAMNKVRNWRQKDQVSNMKSKIRSTSPLWNTYTVDHRTYTMGATSIHVNGEASGDKLMRFGICDIGNILSIEKSCFSIQKQTSTVYTKNRQILECTCHSTTPQFQQKTHGNILGRCFVPSTSVITV